MTVSPISAIGGADSSSISGLTQMLATGTTTDPTAASSTIGSDLNTSIGSIGTGLSVDPNSAAGKAAAVRSSDFGSMIGNGLQQVENLDLSAQTKAIGAATGDLTDIHDYVIAATEAQTATELTTTLRNKALDSFNQIMGMSL